MKNSGVILGCIVLFTVAGCRNKQGSSGGESTSSTSQKNENSKQASDSKSGGGDASGEQKAGSVPTDSVRIATADQARAGIGVAAVTVRSMPRTLDVSGQVAMDERHTNHIGTLADGRIESVSVLPGDRVRRGQTLATLHSHTVHETVAALTQAFADVTRQESAVKNATQTRDRYAKLYSIQAGSLEEKQRAEQDLAQAQKDLVDAEANVRAEREHLSELLQVSPSTLQPGTLYNRELIPVRAVADGVVITRSISPGQVVNMGDEAFVTSNLSSVWVNAAVNEADVPSMHTGAPARVLLQQNSGNADNNGMTGRVAMLGDVVDPQTRTLPVRIAVVNTQTRLRPGMFVTAQIAEPATKTSIFVPTDALQDVNGFRVVFATADGTTFQARAVKTGVQSGGMVEVVEGLQPTDHVVVNGAFMVKGELLKGTVGEG